MAAKKKKMVKNAQKTAVKRVKPKFTPEQIKEQKQFTTALKQNEANITFKGSFKEGLSFIKETGNLVDSIRHA